MSFFKKLFGGGSFEDAIAEGDRLFAEDALEDARLAYQRALERKKGASPEAIARCEERVAACLDGMAERRMADAERLAGDGHLDLAETELRNAMETAASPEIVKRARRALEMLEREDARQKAEVPDEIGDDDRWALLAGSWEPDQMDEYDEYGEPFREALLAMHDGRVKEARATLEALAEEHADEARFLWLEVGRARILDEDLAAAEPALRKMLERVDADEAADAVLSAHAELAGIRDRQDDEEGAIAELQGAMQALPDDPRPFYLMGRFLRSKGHSEEAADVLEAAVPLLDETRPDARFLEELGLAKLESGREEEAAAYLDRVIALHVQLRRLDFPPATAVARARIHENAGELEKAADLYRGLANGNDRENHLTYHREAARLLIQLELPEEARRMLTRALALAENDPESRAAVEAQLAELE